MRSLPIAQKTTSICNGNIGHGLWFPRSDETPEPHNPVFLKIAEFIDGLSPLITATFLEDRPVQVTFKLDH
jgi:hypothetical protein